MKNVAEIVVKWKFYDLKSIIFHHIINHHTNKKADNWILLKPSVLGYGDTTFHQKSSLNSQKCGHEMVKLHAHIISHHKNIWTDKWIFQKTLVLGSEDTTFHQKSSLISQKCGLKVVKLDAHRKPSKLNHLQANMTLAQFST